MTPRDAGYRHRRAAESWNPRRCRPARSPLQARWFSLHALMLGKHAYDSGVVVAGGDARGGRSTVARSLSFADLGAVDVDRRGCIDAGVARNGAGHLLAIYGLIEGVSARLSPNRRQSCRRRPWSLRRCSRPRRSGSSPTGLNASYVLPGRDGGEQQVTRSRRAGPVDGQAVGVLVGLHRAGDGAERGRGGKGLNLEQRKA